MNAALPLGTVADAGIQAGTTVVGIYDTIGWESGAASTVNPLIAAAAHRGQRP